MSPKSIRSRERNRINKIDAMIHYGGCKCGICEIEDIDILTLDHINGGGTRHRRNIGVRGNGFYSYLKKDYYPSGYRVLCYSCNSKEYRMSKENESK